MTILIELTQYINNMNIRYFLFFCFFILASDIFGQIYVDRFVEGLFLDEYPNAAAAFSFRRLDKDYTGNVVRLRRTNNDTLSFGFVDNYLDTAAIKSWCGSTSTDTCFVRDWFDQSGSNLTMSQTTAVSQPRICLAGVLTKNGDHVGIRFDGTNDFMETSSFNTTSHPITFFTYFNFISLENNVQVLSHNSSRNAGSIFDVSDATIVTSAGTTLNSNVTASLNTEFLVYVLSNEVNSEIQVNNTTLVSGSAGNENRTYNRVNFSHNISSADFNGIICEHILYLSNRSTNKNKILININNFYSIY